MYARIVDINANSRETRVNVTVDAEQLAVITQAWADGETEFEIVVQKTAEAIGD